MIGRRFPMAGTNSATPAGTRYESPFGRSAAELGRIVIARGVVVAIRPWCRVGPVDRRAKRCVGPAPNGGTPGKNRAMPKDHMSRFGVMQPCGVGRRTQSQQSAERQNKTHCIRSIATAARMSCAHGWPPPQAVRASRSITSTGSWQRPPSAGQCDIHHGSDCRMWLLFRWNRETERYTC
jgi:hypothetical protein